MPTDWIVAAHLFATFAMTGIIWFVQIVHYPMLARLPHENFAALEREHHLSEEPGDARHHGSRRQWHQAQGFRRES